ncbi:MAG: hypothetical protein AAGU15_00370 [Anaerolineaceae bacterium]
MRYIGDYVGRVAITLILYLFLRLILMGIINWYRRQKKPLPDVLMKINQFVIKTHRFVGVAALGVVILHAFLQYRYYGIIPIAGLIAAIFLAIQLILGFTVRRQKEPERRKKLAFFHRMLGTLIVITVLVHRIIGARMGLNSRQ